MYDLSPINILLLCLAGVGSGFVNTIAGGGSLLTLPALMLLGLPADIANGTNRISVLAQSASTLQGFHSAGKFDAPAAVGILSAAGAGALVGSLTASWVPVGLLKPLLLGSMMAMAALMLLRPAVMAPPEGTRAQALSERRGAALALFGVGLYGGFVQAGVGFPLLLVLGGMLRYDLLRANALKIACSGVFGIVPLAVFLIAGKVWWVPGLVLAGATVVGSRLGVRFAIGASQRALRWILFAMVLVVTGAAFFKG